MSVGAPMAKFVQPCSGMPTAYPALIKSRGRHDLSAGEVVQRAPHALSTPASGLDGESEVVPSRATRHHEGWLRIGYPRCGCPQNWSEVLCGSHGMPDPEANQGAFMCPCIETHNDIIHRLIHNGIHSLIHSRRRRPVDYQGASVRNVTAWHVPLARSAELRRTIPYGGPDGDPLKLCVRNRDRKPIGLVE